MIKKFKIKQLNVTLVLRHRFERLTPFDPIFKRWELGIWFRKSRIVSRKEFTKPNKWGDNLVGSYMVGIEFMIGRAWIEFNKNGMEF